MRDKLKALYTKYSGPISYVFFGGLTTIVNYLVYFPCYNLWHWNAVTSTMLAWAVSVVFAFVTNKPFVFQSHDWSSHVLWPELCRFVGCRFGSGVLETGILAVTVELLQWNGNLWKILTSVIVIIINYVGSKWVVFRNK